MRYKVIEAFNTPLRRFAEGETITDDEIDGPLPAEQWARLKRIELTPTQPRQAAATPVPKPEPRVDPLVPEADKPASAGG